MSKYQELSMNTAIPVTTLKSIKTRIQPDVIHRSIHQRKLYNDLIYKLYLYFYQSKPFFSTFSLK